MLKRLNRSACLAMILLLNACAPAATQMDTRKVMGMEISFDARGGDIGAVPDLMIGFSLAFAQRDANAMQNYVTEDFRWHMNFVDQGPKGKTLSSIPGIMSYLETREKNWESGEYSNHNFYTVGEKVFHTYHLKGVHIQTGPFDVNGVDIYTLRDGKIAIKDSYWKRGPF